MCLSSQTSKRFYKNRVVHVIKEVSIGVMKHSGEGSHPNWRSQGRPLEGDDAQAVILKDE